MPCVEEMSLKQNSLPAAKSKYSFGDPCLLAMALMAFMLACRHSNICDLAAKPVSVLLDYQILHPNLVIKREGNSFVEQSTGR